MHSLSYTCRWACGGLALGLPASGWAAPLDGAALSPWTGLPFAGLLLSIALVPLWAPRLWHRHDGKITATWALAVVLLLAVAAGPAATGGALLHALLAEYLPFLLLVATLYTVSGGIYLRGNWHGSPALNTGLLALGALLASLMGTTGASMLLIRPLLRANDNRRHNAHVVVFFIFIVSNIGGALTPLGDPPLFLGFLQGVPFFWTLQHLGLPVLALVGALLALFYLLDRWYFGQEGELRRDDPTPDSHSAGIEGGANLLLLGAVVALVLQSGLWTSPHAWQVGGVQLALPGLLRDAGLLAVLLLSLRLTPARVHAANQFGWAPMQEVARLFAGIFITMIPVLAMLRAGLQGPFAGIVGAVTRADGTPDAAMMFWAAGLLSAFLDNAPTYLVFFNIAGGDVAVLTTTLAGTLAAISAGAVFMGAGSYIGNAPNLMVKAMAEDRGVKMPGFFGYMAWSFGILMPLFALLTFFWIR